MLIDSSICFLVYKVSTKSDTGKQKKRKSHLFYIYKQMKELKIKS